MLGRLRLLQTFLRSGRLAWRLLRDPRTPLHAKLILGATLLYLVSPINLFSNLIPVVGVLDDIAVLAFGMDQFFKAVPRWLLAEHETALGRTRDGKPVLRA